MNEQQNEQNGAVNQDRKVWVAPQVIEASAGLDTLAGGAAGTDGALASS